MHSGKRAFQGGGGGEKLQRGRGGAKAPVCARRAGAGWLGGWGLSPAVAECGRFPAVAGAWRAPRGGCLGRARPRSSFAALVHLRDSPLQALSLARPVIIRFITLCPLKFVQPTKEI